MLTGFVALPQDDQARTLSAGNSPFVDGVEFTLTGHRHVFPIIDGTEKRDGYPLPVFTTSLGAEAYLFLSMVLKQKVDADNHILTPSGSFNALVREIIAANAGNTDNQILATIEARMTGKRIRVTRVPFIKLNSKGVRIPSSYINLDIVG